MKCFSCQDECTIGVDAIALTPTEDMAQCAWCHRSEWGVWPHGMTMEDEPVDEDEES